MGKTSEIQWTDATWNVARGCTKVDEDCKYCYMYRDSLNGTRYEPKKVIRTKTVFDLPLRIKEPCKIFTSSLTDFFHEDIDSYRAEAWEIMRKTKHTYQVLTKRPDRIYTNLPEFWDEIKDRVWLGTSVGSQSGIERILELIKLRRFAPTLFLSLEPLHGEINLRWKHDPRDEDKRTEIIDGVPKLVVSQHELLMNIDWVIIGGESGHDKGKYRYRPCKIEWIELLVSHCKEAKVPVFVKQFGTHLSKELKMTDRHGGNIDEFPEHLRIREFPKVAANPI